MNAEAGIRFAQAQIAFLRTFELCIGEKTDLTKAIKKFDKEGVKVFPEDKNLKDFKTAESFFFSGDATVNFFRVGLEGFNIHFPRFLENPVAHSKLEADTILTAYPKYNIGVLLVNFTLEGFTVDEIIFLIQCVEGSGFKFQADYPNFISFDTDEVYPNDILTAYQETISTALGFKNSDHFYGSRCVEIDSFADNPSVDPRKVIQDHPREIYGMLTSDEGWRFVPENYARGKTQATWSSRDFFLAISLGNSVLAINCACGERYEEYKDSQQSLRSAFNYPIEGYFSFEPQIAGLNHGPLLTIETASIHNFLLDQVIKNTLVSDIKNVRFLLNQQEALIEALSKLQRLQVPEVGAMEQNVRDAMGLNLKISEVKQRIEDVERILSVRYNQRINNLMIVLTVLGIGIAVIELFFSSGSAIGTIIRNLFIDR